MQHKLLLSIALFSIAAFFYEVQAAPTAVALRDEDATTTSSSLAVIDTLKEQTGEEGTSLRVKRQGGGCGCCGCGGGCGCGCCCCRPRCCCCCRRCCTCCRTCCCTRCCTCCRPCCCGCGCGCCGCGGGGRKRRSLQNLRIKLAEKLSALLPAAETSSETATEAATVAPAKPEVPEVPAVEVATESPSVETPKTSSETIEETRARSDAVQTPIGQIVDVPEWPNSYGYY